jgi:SIT4 phosphatase-associated protein
VRTRIVEFLAQVFQIFAKEVHPLFIRHNLYNILLHYFELYPFHNILHQKVSEIFTTALEKSCEEQSTLLEETNLVKKILDISKDGLLHTFETTKRHMSNGYNGFIRRLAHKVIELQKKNEDANNFLDAIPEWKEYCEGELLLMTTLESKPLASDPRKKQAH